MSPHALLPEQPDKVVTKIHTTRGLSVRIAEACNLHRSAVYQWRRVPPQWVQVVADIMEMEPEAVRPDIFRPRKRTAPKRA